MVWIQDTHTYKPKNHKKKSKIAARRRRKIEKKLKY